MNEQDVRNITRKFLDEQHLLDFIKIFEKEHNLFRGSHDKIQLPAALNVPQQVVNNISGKTKFEDLEDVSIPSKTTGDFVQYDEGTNKWKRMAALTQGSVVFMGADGYFSEDNTNFFWDAANIRLGINVAAPTARIDIIALAASNAPGINISAGVNGEMSTPDGEVFRWGHWNGVDTFTERLKFDAAGKFYVSYLTTASVVFAGAGGEIKQDNANFYWDFTNKRLGIGKAPSNVLDVEGVGTTVGGNSYGGVIARFRCTEAKHTSISIDASAGKDPVLYFAESGVGIWDIRNDASATDEFQIRYQVGEANRTDFKIDNAGNIEIPTGYLGIKSNHELRFYDNGNYVGFEAPALGANQIWVLPSADGPANEVLGTDNSGNLIWRTHDEIAAFVANEHIDHTSVSISAGGILSGGGTIAANRTISLAHGDVDHDQTANFVANEHIDHTGVSISAGGILSGGGTIAANRTISLAHGDVDHDQLANFAAGEHFTMLDEDNFASNSATKAATQQSIKAYIAASSQPLDAELTAIAGLTSAANRYIRFTGSGTADLRTYANVRADIGAAAASHAMSTHSDEDTYNINTSGTLTAGNATLGTIGCGAITSSGTIQATTAKLTGLTDGYIPYHVADATGLANSLIFTDGTTVSIGTASPSGRFQVVGAAATHNQVYFDAYGEGETSVLYIRKSYDDVVGNVTETISGNIIGQIQWRGVNSGSSFALGAYVEAVQDGAATATAVPTNIVFHTHDGTSSHVPLVLHNDGNVGIGTSSPEVLLEVAASGTASSVKVGQIRLQSLGVNDGYYLNNLYYDGAWKYGATGYGIGLLTSAGEFSFYTAPSGIGGEAATLAERVRITNVGNVGIGTSGPAGMPGFGKTLHIKGDAGNDASIRIEGQSGIGGSYELGISSGKLQIFRDASNCTMVMDNAGNVGIGTTSPGAILHTKIATSWGTSLLLENTNDDSSPATMWFHKNPTSGGATMADNDYIGFLVFRGIDSGGNAINWGEFSCQATDVTDGTEDSKFTFSTYAGGVQQIYNLVINAGNVGIGTAAPTWDLTVYKAANMSCVAQFGNSVTGILSADGFLVGINALEQAILWNQENTDMLFYTNDTLRVTIAAAGTVTFAGNIVVGGAGDGTVTGGSDLFLEAGVAVKSTTIRDNTTALAASVCITSTASALLQRSTSARKYKTKIKDLELDSTLVRNLRPVSFNSKCKNDDKGKRFIGLIADEIKEVYPEIVQYGEDGEVEGYDHQMLLTLALKEIQRLDAKLEEYDRLTEEYKPRVDAFLDIFGV